VLIDLSGTLHIDERAIPGSIEAVKRVLQSHSKSTTTTTTATTTTAGGGLQVRFVTNTSKESAASLRARLGRLGLPLPAEGETQMEDPVKIFSSLTAARTFLRSRSLRPLLLLSPNSLSDFADLDTRDPNAVVIGLAPDAFHYERLNEAFRLLVANPAAPLIAVNKSRYMKVADGFLSLGAGAFVSALEFSSGRTAHVIGKPSQGFFQTVLDDIGCTADEAVMIGDDLVDDVGGAQAAGLRGFLVRTGKFRAEDEHHEQIHPDGIFNDLAAAIDHILSFH